MKRMKRWTGVMVFLVVSAVATGAIVRAQGGGTGAGKTDKTAMVGDVKGLIEQLASSDLKVREQAYKKLRDQGEKIRQNLYDALRSDESEVRWNVSRLLDELDARRAGGLHRLGESGRLGKNDVVRSHSQHDPGDDVHRLLDRLRRGARGLPGFGVNPFELDLDGPFGSDLGRMFGEEMFGSHWKEMWDRVRKMRSGLVIEPGAQMDITVSRQDEKGKASLRLTVDPDGKVRAEVKRGGEEETITADSLEAFRREYNDLLEEFGVSGFVRDGQGDSDARPGASPPSSLPATPRGGLRRLGPADQIPDSNRARLGVMVESVSDVLAQHLGLEDGVGLLVRQVMPDSLASRLGIERLDVIVSLDGQAIRTPEDVGARLEKRDAKKPVELEVIRKGKKVMLREKDRLLR